MVVAIDGPAGAGKSTVARSVARELGFVYLNSGSLYRGVTLLCMEAQVTSADIAAVCAVAREAGFSFTVSGLESSGRPLEHLLRSDAVESRVMEYAAIPELRDIVNEIQRTMASRLDVIVEGRDTTTRVFPEAECKFYLDADLAERAGRREAQGSSALEGNGLRAAMEERDRKDRERTVGPLVRSPDAQYIDTTGLTIGEVCAKVLHSIQSYMKRQEINKEHGR